MDAERGLDYCLVFGSLAIIVNGFFGNDIRNDVDIPLSAKELVNPEPPTKTSRLIYILFGIALLGFALFRLIRRLACQHTHPQNTGILRYAQDDGRTGLALVSKGEVVGVRGTLLSDEDVRKGLIYGHFHAHAILKQLRF